MSKIAGELNREMMNNKINESLENVLIKSAIRICELELERDTAWGQAHRLALELECLLLDTKDNATVSKWWDSGMEALSEFHELNSCENELDEAWEKMRKAGI